MPLCSGIQDYWRELILGTFYMLATYVLFYLMTTFSLSYGRAPINGALPGLGYDYTTFVLMIIVGVVFFGIFTLVSGLLADRWGRRKTLIYVTIRDRDLRPHLGADAGGHGFAGVMAWLIIGFVSMGMTFGPMGALLPELFPANVRFHTGSGISLSPRSWARPSLLLSLPLRCGHECRRRGCRFLVRRLSSTAMAMLTVTGAVGRQSKGHRHRGVGAERTADTLRAQLAALPSHRLCGAYSKPSSGKNNA